MRNLMCPYCGSRLMNPQENFPEVFRCTARECQKICTIKYEGTAKPDACTCFCHSTCDYCYGVAKAGTEEMKESL